MICFNCETEIPAKFEYAIRKNVCPACGKEVLDEETIGIIEDIKNVLASEIKLRPETLENIAYLLLSKYNISVRNGRAAPAVVAPASQTSKAKEPQSDVIKTEDVQNIPESERDAILEQVISQRYGVSLDTTSVAPTRSISRDLVGDVDLSESDVLEAERINRVKKQQANMTSGKSSFRR